MSNRSVLTKAWIFLLQEKEGPETRLRYNTVCNFQTMKSVGLKRQLLKFQMLFRVDIQENSRVGNSLFIFLGIKLGRVKGPGELNFQAFTGRA